MIAALTTTAAALVVGLPIFALGERIRERRERRLNHSHLTTRKDLT